MLIVDKERTFCCDVGAAQHLSMDYFSEITETFKQATMVVSESYFFINHVKIVHKAA